MTLTKWAVLFLSCAVTTACQTTSASWVPRDEAIRTSMELTAEQARWRITENQLKQASLLQQRAERIAVDFRHRAHGGLHATVAGISSKQADYYASLTEVALVQAGIPPEKIEVTALTIPASSTYHPKGVLLSYEVITVEAPDCKLAAYQKDAYGCETDGQLAKMVVHPSDLSGRVTKTDRLGDSASGAVSRHVERDFTTAPSLLEQITTTE